MDNDQIVRLEPGPTVGDYAVGEILCPGQDAVAVAVISSQLAARGSATTRERRNV